MSIDIQTWGTLTAEEIAETEARVDEAVQARAELHGISLAQAEDEMRRRYITHTHRTPPK